MNQLPLLKTLDMKFKPLFCLAIFSSILIHEILYVTDLERIISLLLLRSEERKNELLVINVNEPFTVHLDSIPKVFNSIVKSE